MATKKKSTAPRKKSAATVKLEKKIERFIEEYVQDFNGTRAALAAGMGPKDSTAATAACKLLKNPTIKTRVDEAHRARIESSRATADDILRELEYVAFSRITDVLEWDADGCTTFIESSDLPPAHRAAIQSIEVEHETRQQGEDVVSKVKKKVSQHSKLRALDQLARMHGLYQDKMEVSHEFAPLIIMPGDELPEDVQDVDSAEPTESKRKKK